MKKTGFTLVEMVLTIVIMGVLFLGMAGFVEKGTKGYIDTIDRQKLQNQARFVIEKLSREIRHAVPNSFETETTSSGNKCLNFYPIKGSGFYTQNESDDTIEFISDNQGGRLASPSTESMVINPSRIEDLTSADHSVSLAGCRVSASSTCNETELSSGVFLYAVEDRFTSHSIANRFFMFDQEVAYCITTGGLITRNGVTVADGMNYTQSSFSYQQATLQRGGLVHLDFLFTDKDQDEESFYKHDVRVLNVP